MNTDLEDQEDELLALHSIFGLEEFVRNESNPAGEIRVSVELPADFTVALTEGETVRQYEISFLPPLLLTFELPEDYPSSSPPSFTLTCSWLTHIQLSALGAQLTDLYQATGGAVVLFSWVQFLREDTLQFLDIHTLLELYSDEHSTLRYSQDSQNAALSETKNNQDTPKSDDQSCNVSDLPLLIYDAAQKQKVFAATVFDCSVCFVGWLGSECVQLPECGHIFCQACLTEFCKLHITEGNVRGVTCPQADCKASPTPAQVKSLVGEELFSRYDRLLLQSTLDLMPADVAYCPRLSCASPVILEKSSTAALCSVCGFAFCVTLCRCVSEAVLCVAVCASEGLKALWDDYTSGSKQRQLVLQSRYSRRVLQVNLEGSLSEHWMEINSKNCPHCFCRIEKNRGCNIMTCSQCRKCFCWACLTRLPYAGASVHFEDSPCSVYQDMNFVQKSYFGGERRDL
uniref:RBR-type E3 ubiquitin transferase n=1 Tax=Seriola lalandi dorsalis TaxID=1841481 RepID=A0A3B4Y7I0_SERLL